MNEEKINLIIETFKDVDTDIIWRFIDLDTEQYEDDRKVVFYILDLIDEYKRLKENEQAYFDLIQNKNKLKQKIKDKIEYLDKNYSEFSEYPIEKTKQVLQELLKEE